ncbi:MAG: hypothetical protein Q9163_000128 [Psora crenata]
MPDMLIDDKAAYCLPFILEQLEQHKVSTLAGKLSQPPHSLPTTVLSIDDFYLPHQAQRELAKNHVDNPLVQHRGQPSTHDLPLALTLLSNLRAGMETRLPRYDKSALNGLGDRIPEDQWPIVNKSGQPKIKIVILEGWCIGFRQLPPAELEAKWKEAVSHRKQGEYEGRLGWNELFNISFVNDALREYDELTDQLDAIIHIDAADPMFAYQWRLQQERALRELRGSGMTDNQVHQFVNGYYPAYELYTDGLHAGALRESGKQLRLIINRDRRVQGVVRI